MGFIYSHKLNNGNWRIIIILIIIIIQLVGVIAVITIVVVIVVVVVVLVVVIAVVVIVVVVVIVGVRVGVILKWLVRRIKVIVIKSKIWIKYWWKQNFALTFSSIS